MMKYTVKTPFVETETVVSGKNEKFTIIVTAVVTIMVAAVGIFFYFVYKSKQLASNLLSSNENLAIG